MKTRTGFVSNSSSSSFILIFDDLPNNVKDMQELLNFSCANKEFSHGDYAQRVLDDLEDGTPSDEDIKELLGSNAYWDLSDKYSKAYREEDSEKRRELLNNLDNEYEKLKELKLKEFKKKYSNKNVRIVGYSDNDSIFDASLEHGELFSNIEHIHINHH